MEAFEQLTALKERLKDKESALALDIQLVTAWIREHLEDRPSYGSTEYHSWRRVSCRFHQKRSELKAKQDNIQLHLRVIAQKLDGMETSFSDFPFFWDLTFEPESVPAGV